MRTIKSKKYLPVLQVVKINLKHNAALSIVISICIIIITPIIFGIANLNRTDSAIPLEMFVSLIGIIFLTPIFQPEQNNEIGDLVSSKYISTNLIYFIRTIYAVFLSIIFIGSFVVYMSIQKCDITFLLFIGTVANAIFLGSLGMITAALTENTIIAYMIPLVYYMLNYGAGSKLGNYYLFSMYIPDFKPKVWLLITGILFIFLSLIVKKFKKKFQ